MKAGNVKSVAAGQTVTGPGSGVNTSTAGRQMSSGPSSHLLLLQSWRKKLQNKQTKKMAKFCRNVPSERKANLERAWSLQK